MPEPRDWGHENLLLTFRVLLVSGVLLLFGSAVAYLSGRDGVSPAQHHIDATMVLGGLGVVAIVAGLTVLWEAQGRVSGPRPREERPGRYYPPESRS